MTRVVQVANFYGPRSGGLRTAVDRLGAEYCARGHEVFLIDEDVPATPDVTHILGFRMLGVTLKYPEVGRTLGLWRNWIGRQLKVSVLANVSESPSGRLAFYRRVERNYQDRFPDGLLSDIQSGS